MKKLWIVIMVVVLLLAACSNGVEEGEVDGTDEVIVVFPASISMDGDTEGMTAEIQEAGATSVEENEDGSVSVAISAENLDKLKEKYHQELSEMIDGIHSEGNMSSIKDIAYDEERFNTYDLTVDKAAYQSEDSMDGLLLFGLAMQSLMYQVYNGEDEADIQVIFNLIDESTGEIFETNTLPE